MKEFKNEITEKKQLIKDYMSKCPFIEFHAIEEIDEEVAVIRVAFDEEYGA